MEAPLSPTPISMFHSLIDIRYDRCEKSFCSEADELFRIASNAITQSWSQVKLQLERVKANPDYSSFISEYISTVALISLNHEACSLMETYDVYSVIFETLSHLTMIPDVDKLTSTKKGVFLDSLLDLCRNCKDSTISETCTALVCHMYKEINGDMGLRRKYLQTCIKFKPEFFSKYAPYDLMQSMSEFSDEIPILGIKIKILWQENIPHMSKSNKQPADEALPSCIPLLDPKSKQTLFEALQSKKIENPKEQLDLLKRIFIYLKEDYGFLDFASVKLSMQEESGFTFYLDELLRAALSVRNLMRNVNFSSRKKIYSELLSAFKLIERKYRISLGSKLLQKLTGNEDRTKHIFSFLKKCYKSPNIGSIEYKRLLDFLYTKSGHNAGKIRKEKKLYKSLKEFYTLNFKLWDPVQEKENIEFYTKFFELNIKQ